MIDITKGNLQDSACLNFPVDLAVEGIKIIFDAFPFYGTKN